LVSALAESAKNEPQKDLQERIFKEDFKPVTVEGGKRRTNASGASQRVVKHETITKSAPDSFNPNIDDQSLSSSKSALLEEEFDLLSFDEPTSIPPLPIQSSDLDTFEAQFG
jgi:hypothetical protein